MFRGSFPFSIPIDWLRYDATIFVQRPCVINGPVSSRLLCSWPCGGSRPRCFFEGCRIFWVYIYSMFFVGRRREDPMGLLQSREVITIKHITKLYNQSRVS